MGNGKVRKHLKRGYRLSAKKFSRPRDMAIWRSRPLEKNLGRAEVRSRTPPGEDCCWDMARTLVRADCRVLHSGGVRRLSGGEVMVRR